MSLEAPTGQRSGTPTSSGRSTPIGRITRRHADDEVFKSDKNLRRYGAGIERALTSWEIAPEEWADYIAFLARLLKAIQAHPKDSPLLPHSSSIATKLAQCLNPALPSGVHQKALEVYNYIFETFGAQFIATHLHEYLSGLAGVLSFASLTVRPGLYSLFENYIVSIAASDLRPALKSLILSLLPALEEESGEDFERAFQILQSLETSFAFKSDHNEAEPEPDGYFWQCLFLSVITSSSRRQGALNYLTRRLPKLTTKAVAAKGNGAAQDSSSERVVSPEPGLLIRAFVCGLSDAQVLIQRGFLDLLVANLPLNSFVLQEKVSDNDLDRLVTAAMQVLLRRDMGLNRRLWTWFLGPENKEQANENTSPSRSKSVERSDEAESNVQIKYFSKYGRASLERCVLRLFKNPTQKASERARPFRICLSLMDRWEIGELLIPQVFMPAMRSLHGYSSFAPAADVAEVVRSASLFFDGVEANLIWRSLLVQIHEGFNTNPAALQNAIQLVQWIIKTFNVKDDEMLSVHLPQTLIYILSNIGGGELQTSQATMALATIAHQLLELIPASAFNNTKTKTNNAKIATEHKQWTNEEVRQFVLKFYGISEKSSASTQPTFSASDFPDLVIPRVTGLAASGLASQDALIFTQANAMLVVVLSKSGALAVAHLGALKATLLEAFVHVPVEARAILPFPLVSSTVHLLSSLRSSQHTRESISRDELIAMEAELMKQIWHYLSPSQSKYHVEAVKLIWTLEDLIAPESVVASLAGLLRGEFGGKENLHELRPDAVRRFTVLWSHTIPSSSSRAGTSRRKSSAASATDPYHSHRIDVLKPPLLLVLDLLVDPKYPAFDAVRTWIRSLPSLDQVLLYLFQMLDDTLSKDSFELSDSRQHGRLRRSKVRDLDYILSHFRNLLQNGDSWVWQCLVSTPVRSPSTGEEKEAITVLGEFCIQSLFTGPYNSEPLNRRLIEILGLLLSDSRSGALKNLEIDVLILDRLPICLSSDMPFLQGELLRLLTLALKLRLTKSGSEEAPRPRTRGSISAKAPPVVNMRPTTSSATLSTSLTPPPQLFKCIELGFSSKAARFSLDRWLVFLNEMLSLFSENVFTNLIPLVECFCQELSRAHEELVALSRKRATSSTVAPDAAIIHLLDGLEMILDRAYENLISENVSEPTAKPVETSNSFLTNVTSGVFKVEGSANKTVKANHRLTVILALHDSIRVILRMWLWASKATDHDDVDTVSISTTAHNALKVRNKTRHLLEQIFAVEQVESLEIIMTYWCTASGEAAAISILDLLHVMQVSRPKTVVTAILDALYTRTNPSALSPARQSSQTVELNATDVALFLSAYLKSTEDDATDEIWADCLAFLRDILANPLPYRQILPHMLSMVLLLAEKLNNTNYGEQRKMRRDLGDLFSRLLTATFTTLPSGYVAEPADPNEELSGIPSSRHTSLEHSMTLTSVLNRITADLDLILDTADRMTPAMNTISTSLVSPILRAKSFPKNVSRNLLSLIVNIAKKSPTLKSWKKDVGDAFNDPRIFLSPHEVMTNGWFPLLHQWSLHDKERMPELLARLAPPSTAGIMFGVGASAARLEADRKTQLNLRRICLLLLASPEDTHVAHLRVIQEKIAELFEASPSSSPSITIKAELFMLCRTLAVSISSLHLAPLWPIVNDKLQGALLSLLPSSSGASEFNNLALLQACKLLDLLLALAPDDFQLHEWLYITDTIDAVYQPPGGNTLALADHIAASLDSNSVEEGLVAAAPSSVPAPGSEKKRTLLSDNMAVDNEDVKAFAREDFTGAVLRPFLNQLSIHAYEGVYSLEVPDLASIRSALLVDITDLNTIVE